MTTFVSRFAIAAVATTLATAAANAEALIQKFNVDNVKAAITSLGITDVASRKESADGKTIDLITFNSGATRHVGLLTVCDEGGCLGLSLITVWDGGDTVSYETLNKFNASFHFGRAYKGSSNLLAFGRYAISDGGVSEENLRANIGNFVNGSQVFQKYVQDSAIVSSLTPPNPSTAQLTAAPNSEIGIAMRSALAARELNRLGASASSIAPSNHNKAR